MEPPCPPCPPCHRAKGTGQSVSVRTSASTPCHSCHSWCFRTFTITFTPCILLCSLYSSVIQSVHDIRFTFPASGNVILPIFPGIHFDIFSFINFRILVCGLFYFCLILFWHFVFIMYIHILSDTCFVGRCFRAWCFTFRFTFLRTFRLTVVRKLSSILTCCLPFFERCCLTSSLYGLAIWCLYPAMPRQLWSSSRPDIKTREDQCVCNYETTHITKPA